MCFLGLQTGHPVSAFTPHACFLVDTKMPYPMYLIQLQSLKLCIKHALL